MRSERVPDSRLWRIVRGAGPVVTAFCCLIDHDSSCWSKRMDLAARYKRRSIADDRITELRRRETLKRKGRR